MRRVLGVAAAVVALAMALSGCSLFEDGKHVFEDVQRGLTAQGRLDRLAKELQTRDDVITVLVVASSVHQAAIVTVTMGDSAAPDAIAEVVKLTDETLRSTDLLPMKREFEVTADSVSIRQTNFTQEPLDYAAELAYWGVVQELIGSGLALTIAGDRNGSFQRMLSTQTDSTVVAISTRVDDLTAVVPPNGVETRWRLPGVASFGELGGSLPDKTVLAFLATMAGVTNLLDDSVPEEPPGVFVSLPTSSASYLHYFMLVANEATTPQDSEATWKLGLKMAREVVATGLPAFRLDVQTLGNEMHEDVHIYVGECAELDSTYPPSPVDNRFFADLVAGGADLPHAGAGICQAFALQPVE